jgi:hypothetical protein
MALDLNKANGIWLRRGPGGGSALFEIDEKYVETVDTSLGASASTTTITNERRTAFRYCKGRINETCKLDNTCAVISR